MTEVRVLKFRGWEPVQKIMFYPGDLGDGGKAYNLYFNGYGVLKGQIAINKDGGDFAFDSFPCLVMQFTGLCDSSNKDIYEGDIIRGANRKLWVVEWGKAGWCLNNQQIVDPKFKFAGDESYSFERWMAFHPSGLCKVDIVGNIYESSDLIQEKIV